MRIARTGFWLSLFRFQGATGHTPIQPELVPGVPKDCSRRTATAGKSPSGAGGPWGAFPAGVSPYQARHERQRVQARKYPPGRHPGPTRASMLRCLIAAGYPQALTRDFRRRPTAPRFRRRPATIPPTTPLVACGEPLRPSACHPVSGAQQAFRSRSAPNQSRLESVRRLWTTSTYRMSPRAITRILHYQLLHRRDMAMTFRPDPSGSVVSAPAIPHPHISGLRPQGRSGSGDVRIPVTQKRQRLLGCLLDADPRPAAGTSGGGVPSSRSRTHARGGRPAPSPTGRCRSRPGDPEGLAQLGRPAAQVAVGGPSAGRPASPRVPATGASARISTAAASPSGPQTTLAHQCMP